MATPKQTRMPWWHTYILAIIFVFALFVRVYDLGSLPTTFYTEEMTNTYVGKFILLHGKDIYNHPLPLVYFDKFGDYPPVLPLYLSGLGALIFGTNEFGGRFPLALSGALMVFPIFGLAYLLFKRKDAAYFAAFLTAVTPWHIVLSRTTAEGVVGMTAYAYGILWLLQGILESNKRKLYYSFIAFILTYFLYPGLRILTPMTLLPLPWLLPKIDKPIKKILILGIIGFFVLTAYISSTVWGQARFKQTSLFGDPVVRESLQKRSEALSNMLGANQITKARIFHNKYVLYTREFASQYLNYFSPKYLFFEAGGQFRYYNVPDQGLFYLSVIPLVVGALLLAGSAIPASLWMYVIYLLLISPISSALTTDFTPHVHRSMFLMLPIILIASGGFIALWTNEKWKRIIVVLAFGVMMIEGIYFWHQYREISPSFQSTLRNDGDTQLAKYLVAHKDEYDHVYVTKFDRIPLYYLFYANNFDKNLIGQFEPGFSIKDVDNITFVESECPSSQIPQSELSKKILVIDFASCGGKEGLKGLEAIDRRDGTSAYRIFTTK